MPRSIQRASGAVLLLGLVATGLITWGVFALRDAQEHRLLKTRTAEVGLVLTQAATTIPGQMGAQGSALKATGLSTSAYQQVASSGSSAITYAWLTPLDTGRFQVLAATGSALATGDVVDGVRAQTLGRALTTARLVATPISGPDRVLGFALGPPAAPAGTVLYQQWTLGPVVTPPRQASTAPFAELDLALYAAPTADPQQIIVRTTDRLPSGGSAHSQTLAVGDARWLLTVRAQRPLVGGLAAAAPWLAAVLGLAGSLLTATVVETGSRRRQAAAALYAAERASGETLQRSLLPRLPEVPGLDLAARYVPGSAGQQVGGDWFDVFPLAGNCVGVVIGDVMGHDLAAAGAMAQIRAALRAYALDVQGPALVLDQLDRLVTTFEIAELATVVYGVLGPVRPDGGRSWRWSNAGHPSPLLRLPLGDTSALEGGESLLLGTPTSVVREEAACTVSAGSALILFTDGLIEVPGESLDDAVVALCEAVRVVPVATAEGLCSHLASLAPLERRRDDIALLVIRLALD